MRTRNVVLAVLALLFGSCSWLVGEPEPNVLWVVVDDLRYDALSGSAGSAEAPNLARLRREALDFRSCFSHSPAAVPALAALLSGREASRAGVRAGRTEVPQDVPLVSEHLRRRGYRTHAVVARDDLLPAVSGLGIDRGFEVFDAPAGPRRRADEVAELARRAFAGPTRGKPWMVLAHFADPAAPWGDPAGGDPEGGGADAAEGVTLTLDGDELERLSAARAEPFELRLELEPGRHQLVLASDEPFVVRELSCAGPAYMLEPWYQEGEPGGEETRVQVELENRSDAPLACTLRVWIHDRPGPSEARRRYRRRIETVDRAFGALVAELRRTGQYERTLIVVTGTHGASLGEHGLFGSGGGLWDELLRVPLVLKLPEGHEAERPLRHARELLVRHMDVAPTVLDLAGQPPLAGADGISLLEPAPRVLLAEAFPPAVPHPVRALRDGRFKLLYGGQPAAYQMYDLPVDPLEMDNVFRLRGNELVEWQDRLRELAQGGARMAAAD